MAKIACKQCKKEVVVSDKAYEAMKEDAGGEGKLKANYICRTCRKANAAEKREQRAKEKKEKKAKKKEE